METRSNYVMVGAVTMALLVGALIFIVWLAKLNTNENPFPHLADMDYRAVRTDRYKYVHWMRFPDQDELYDLQADSLERTNLARDPGHTRVRAELREELGRLVLQAMGLASARR